eukprot:CAMPEP_0184011110 /NCGR_PEP_ID=MMETSP0954-20121128/3630_1 /TAXON_ID=627963 /ORGANISM="Aplanochytrium sp, Strain PBS07" /LENGTH=220 /DNA_ID=CAMNT_0026290861 /DNA_START=41 /DNA_END=700 /DNA_ORIENTATION=-
MIVPVLFIVIVCLAIFITYVFVKSKPKLQQLAEQGRVLQLKQPGGKRQEQPFILFQVWIEDLKQKEKSFVRSKFKNGLAKDILDLAKPENLTFYCDDPENDAPAQAMNISPLAPAPAATVCFGPVSCDEDFLSDLVDQFLSDLSENICMLMSKNGCTRTEAYLVDQSIYTEYGEYAGPCTKGFWPNETAKSWPDGIRTPFPVTLTAFPVPASRKNDLKSW